VERTLFFIKPDGVKRGLTGECFRRVEQAGLKITGLKMVLPTKEQADKHYPDEKDDINWFKGVAEKARKGFEEKGMEFKWDDLEYGRMIKSFLVDFLTSGPIIVSVIEGPNAIEMVRKISGNTEPRKADIGTIRGDFTLDSYDLANSLDRPLKNIVHASSSKEDAEKEIKLWFTPEEITKYKRCDEELMFGK